MVVQANAFGTAFYDRARHLAELQARLHATALWRKNSAGGPSLDGAWVMASVPSWKNASDAKTLKSGRAAQRCNRERESFNGPLEDSTLVLLNQSRQNQCKRTVGRWR